MVTLRGCWEMRDERVIETVSGFLGSVLLDTAGLGGICSLGARPVGFGARTACPSFADNIAQIRLFSGWEIIHSTPSKAVHF